MVLLELIGLFILGFALYFWTYARVSGSDEEEGLEGCSGLGCLTVIAIFGGIGLVVAFVFGFLGAAILGN